MELASSSLRLIRSSRDDEVPRNDSRRSPDALGINPTGVEFYSCCQRNWNTTFRSSGHLNSATSVLTFLSFIDAKGASAHVGAVEGFDCLACAIVIHFDESEAACTTGFAVHDDARALNGTKLAEEI